MKNHTNPPTILWADDDPDDIYIMRLTLQSLGRNYHVIEVHNGREALNYLQQAKEPANLPCLIVLDINMPVFSGRDTLVLLKGNSVFRNIPTVGLTTSSSALDRTFCERYNTEMLTKPLTLETIKHTMQRMLSLCEASAQQQGA